MASIAAHPVHSVPILAPLYVLKMRVAIISLKGRIAGGMAILAARGSQNTIDVQERGAGGGCVRLGWTSCQCSRKQGRSDSAPKYRERATYCRCAFPMAVFFACCEQSHDFAPGPYARSLARIGNRRMRLPVAAKIALARAGATGGTPGSPTPVGLSLLGTMCTSISGDSKIRNIW